MTLSSLFQILCLRVPSILNPWVPGVVFLDAKLLDTDSSRPSSAQSVNQWRFIPAPSSEFMALCLIRHRNNFTNYLFKTSVAIRTMLWLANK
jgi:hypothetical protein